MNIFQKETIINWFLAGILLILILALLISV